MAGTTGRKTLKKAALLALDDSRATLGVEVTRLRPVLHPGEYVRQSMAKHRYAVMAAAAVAGLLAVRLLVPSGRGGKRSLRDHLFGALAGGAWAMLKAPLMEFAKSRFSSSLEQLYNPKPTDPEIPA